ncbi:MAG: 2-nitropropane dioxygenase [Nitrospirae bacterium]|nr:2-nitropropane dioxygenase [Nitrospirota bacterium]
MNDERLNVRCPCCDARLVVDSVSGAVLYHESAEREAKPRQKGSMADMIAELENQRREAAEKVEKEKQNLKDRSRILEEKVKESMKRVDKDDPTPPVRPFDLD